MLSGCFARCSFLVVCSARAVRVELSGRACLVVLVLVYFSGRAALSVFAGCCWVLFVVGCRDLMDFCCFNRLF